MPVLGAIPVIGGLFGGATATWGTALAGIGAVGSVASAGVGAYSSYQAGQTASAVGQANSTIGMLNADMQRRQADYQNKVALRQAEMDALQLNIQAGLQRKRAEVLRQTAEINDATGRENIRRRRLEFERFRATQRSRYAKSGVVLAGTPVAVLAETAANMELEIQDMLVASENRSRSLLNEAAVEDFGAKQTAFSAKAKKEGARQGFAWNRTMSGIDFGSARLAAAGTRIAADSQASAYTAGAWGQGLAGLAGFGEDLYRINDKISLQTAG